MADSDATFQSPGALVDYAKSLDCIHCGLCLQTCPTYRLTGAEPSSPRGRIHLMRAVGEARLEPVADYAAELDFCLLCRHCESVCPAGVRFGAMMEYARGEREKALPRGLLARLARRLAFRVVLPNRLALRFLGSLLALAQRTRLDRLARLWGGAKGLADLPRVLPLPARRLLPRRVSSSGALRERVLFLEGCVMPELYALANRATVESLAGLGVESEIPRGLTCCGSLHAHNGDPEGARRLVRRAIEIYEASSRAAGEPPPLLVNSAGCGAHLKECHQLFAPDDPWRARARELSRRVVDYTEFVAPRLSDIGLGRPAVPTPITWDDPCLLCHGQGIRKEPRAILQRLALEVVELDESESCCGSAGIYSLVQPEASRAIFARKLEAFRRTGAKTLVTANPGCQLQWESGFRRAGLEAKVMHLAELVAAAQRSSPPSAALQSKRSRTTG